jgi:hypothetical protein
MASFTVPLSPRYELYAVLTPDGFDLFTDTGSYYATQIDLERTELDSAGTPGVWSLLAALPIPESPWEGAYRDTQVELGKRYGYRVATRMGDNTSAPVETTTLPIGPPLQTASRQLPTAPFQATDGNGRYAFAALSFDAAASLRLLWGSAAQWWNAEVQQVDSLAGLKLDPAGLPHAVYRRRGAAGSGDLIGDARLEAGGKLTFDGVAPVVVRWEASPGAQLYQLSILSAPVAGPMQGVRIEVRTQDTMIALPAELFASGEL